MGYKKKDILEMQDALEYAMQDAYNNGEEEQAKSLSDIFDLLDGLLVEGRI